MSQYGPQSACHVSQMHSLSWSQHSEALGRGGRSGNNIPVGPRLFNRLFWPIRALVLLVMGGTWQHGSWLILIPRLFNCPWSSSTDGRERGGQVHQEAFLKPYLWGRESDQQAKVEQCSMPPRGSLGRFSSLGSFWKSVETDDFHWAHVCWRVCSSHGL